MLLLTITSWLDHREREMVGYLIEENRVLRRQLGGRRLRLTHDDRRRLGALAYRLGRHTRARSQRSLRRIRCSPGIGSSLPATELAKTGTRRRGVLAEIRQPVARMAEENPTWGYTRSKAR